MPLTLPVESDRVAGRQASPPTIEPSRRVMRVTEARPGRKGSPSWDGAVPYGAMTDER